MFYTVIQKSGWQGDGWRVEKTFSDKTQAEKFVSEHKQRTDPKTDFYNTDIKTHKNPLVKLMDESGAVKFSDGTVATTQED